MTDYDDWVEGIGQKARRLSIVFLQLGAAHQPARRALGQSSLDMAGVREYLCGGVPTEAELVVIDDLETLIDPRRDNLLGQLREKVFADVDLGTRFVLLSRSPRAAFGSVPGSSLLDDASFAHGPVINVDRFELMPSCSVDGLDPDETLQNALTELGIEVCASLDRVLYEDLLVGDEALRLLGARELEALDGAGITTETGGTRRWNFSRHLVQLKAALSSVLAGQLEPQPQLADVSSGLWKVERLLRLAIRNRAIAAWGTSWRVQCLSDSLATEVLNRASESAYLGATSVKQLRDPLEWMSLGELLGLKDLRQIGNLGMSAALWRQFGTQVMPIRNRLAHMRTLHPDDGATVIKWLKVLELKLDLQGKRSASATMSTKSEDS